MSLNKNTLIIIAVIALLFAAAIADVVSFKKNGGNNGTQIITDGQEGSQSIAQSWIEDSAPTYVFDGFNLDLVESKEGECAQCFTFTFSFESRHGGYGDRADLLVTQVITPHTTEVGVKGGKVVRAVTDGKYNEITGALAE